MKVREDHIPEDTFSEFVRVMPQICVEIVVSTEDGILLAKRANKPVRGEWFWPGSRLYKGERLEDAAHRIASEELGIEIELLERLGVHEHFWKTSAEVGHPSRHTVNLVFLVTPVESEFEVCLDDQHSAVKFIEEIRSSHHEYVKDYFAEHNLPR